jgi:2-oxoisovalerate dehydrogenase E2 component (dihydrolipoyl transacylase)
MPDVGEGLTEAEILKWYVKPGDTVTDGQVVCEVETAKAAVELPIPFDGVVRDLHFPEGRTVSVGTPIISVDTGAEGPPAPAEAPAGEAGEAGGVGGAEEASGTEGAGEAPEKRQPVLVGYGVAASATKRRPRKSPAASPAQTSQTGALRQSPQMSPQQPGQASRGKLNGHGPVAAVADAPQAKPPVRKLAKDLGIDLATVRASGAGGVITREDVQAAAAAAPERETAPAVAPAFGDRRETRVPVRGVRKATAAAMVSSAFTAPHVTEFVTFDITRTMKLVEGLKTDPAFEGLKVSPLLLVAKALLVAVRRNPEVNSAWDEANQEIVRKDYVNLGIATATPRGLIVPNIKDAQATTLPELAGALGDLVATARDGRTSPADMQNGTITITNVGVFGVDTGTPILPPGESAILAFGAVRAQPWVHKGKVRPRQVTTLSLSFDHRLIDGELGSRFLGDIAAVLEYPKRLLTWA